MFRRFVSKRALRNEYYRGYADACDSWRAEHAELPRMIVVAGRTDRLRVEMALLAAGLRVEVLSPSQARRFNMSAWLKGE